MKGRLVLAALAAALLTACPPPAKGPQSAVVQQDDHFAIAVVDGGKVVYYPLPAAPYVVVDGHAEAIGPDTSKGIMVIPHCLCGRPDCAKYCMPAVHWWDVPPPLPRDQPQQPMPPTPPGDPLTH
ncbi:MAG TPA: hypothetical protein VHE35_07690 [Kofleriaceae bacterium]|nr:hypothetical protein [Kofleriaceae bacterium]